ncbi:hypothetical protein CSA56_04115 [candidate division KSB3 bacterium]|uniref:Guanylate cyclase domain-containing protein n=1 Tax=candidate division KSB3 bacterium TaxID=2044937 RepID=A0A2G6KIJ8_9BACT|nr:MAG: hypothetical protein CSA56_04115 [candidate division KSB3 bacterium]
MHKFSRFDPELNVRRLPLTYSFGDLSSIRDMFTPENGDIGRTQLPILPPLSGPLNGGVIESYQIEVSSPLLVSIREYLKTIALQQELKHQHQTPPSRSLSQNYAKIRRECMNSIGTRLVTVIQQERRLGVYNLFWLMISKHLVSLFDRVINEKGDKGNRRILEMLPILSQALFETIHHVKLYLKKEDEKKRRYSRYINDTITSHLGEAFNYKFSRSIITNQIHHIFPHITRSNLMACAQAVFVEENERYHITYDEFTDIYSGIRAYIEKHLHKNNSTFCETIATVLRIPCQTVRQLPLEALLFHPTVISLLAEDIKQLPTKNASRKKAFFKSWAPQLGDMFGEDSWEFAIADYINFAKDLRQSELIAFLRERLVFIPPKRRVSTSITSPPQQAVSASDGITDIISYQFDKGRVVHDLRQVTLIFLDLRGFTELSAGDIADQELKENLYNFFDPVVNIINHFEGDIKTYAGDGILAEFRGKKTHALQAIRAAVEIQKFFDILKQEGKTAFTGMGIGIHTGLVEEIHFFTDLEAPSHNTVIGLSANLVGRLSSGKTDKKGQFDPQIIKSLKDYIQDHDTTLTVGSGALAMFEDRLLQAFEALQQHKQQMASSENEGESLSVKVISGVLNNTGIAISNQTFEHIRALHSLKSEEIQKSVRYSYVDDALQDSLTFIKAGDAIFKGIRGKFPVWGVYRSEQTPTAKELY